MTSGPGRASGTTGTPQRCSDAEREQTSSILREAVAEGRLSLDELDERLTAVYAARFRHELAAVTADLPTATPTPGWAAVLSLVWRRLSTDLAGLAGRGPTTLSRRGKIALALAMLAAVALAVTFAALVAHGMVGEGLEHHEFGHHHFGG